jgi:hypothetical protein
MSKESPYYKVAREALIKWNQMNPADADLMIEQSDFDEIEQQVGAKNSMMYAIDSLADQLGLNNGAKADLQNYVFQENYNGNINPIISGILNGYTSDIEWFNSARTSENLNNNGYDINVLVMNMLESVHNGWIKDNTGVFFTKKQDKGQQYQYLPIELIGWDEVKSDLLFVKPIMESVGSQIDENSLKNILHDRTKQYIQAMIKTGSDIGADFGSVGEYIMNSTDSFSLSELPWTEDIRKAFQNAEFVKSVIVPELREKGFGKDYELMNKLAKTPNSEAYINNSFVQEYEPLFWDKEWADEYGYDDVANILLHRDQSDKAEFDEEVSNLTEGELAELVELRSKFAQIKLSESHFDTPQKDSELEELESLKTKLQELREEEKKISETEKLIEQKESNTQSIDE